ncbi:MAG TPA: reverse transcriptase domain-containing protein, partial [Cytophagaceae bacterium]|nr:reverse transcriptase domain-containing protein [Cytophagaceae bacterium]
MEEKDWFRIKKYPHIGRPLSMADKGWVTRYVTDEDKVAAHHFYPLIHRDKTVRKYRRKIASDGKRSKLRYASSKPRELYYANHFDANVYSYYAKLLSDAYNDKLERLGIESCVTSYRRIKINPNNSNSSHKSNSDFAADVFNFILQHEEEHLIAITFDIKSFFDTLKHTKLKKAMCQVLDVTTLRKDYYNVFKNITKFSYINENEIFNEFSDDILVRTKSGIIKKAKVKKRRYLRNQNAIAYCETADFKKKILGNKLVICNFFTEPKSKTPRTVGIPQGSPISAVLANLYMLNFDQRINGYVSEIGGLYRRYSDDMVVICSANYKDKILHLFEEAISERELEIQTGKTQVFEFIKTDGKYVCGQKFGEHVHPHKNFEYLGFEFDGHHSFIKAASLSGFYRKMKRAVFKGAFYSKIDKSKSGIFRSRLYRKFSYKGADRKRIYGKDPADET